MADSVTGSVALPNSAAVAADNSSGNIRLHVVMVLGLGFSERWFLCHLLFQKQWQQNCLGKLLGEGGRVGQHNDIGSKTCERSVQVNFVTP